ncbi:tetratricopeptide repeat protein [Myxococcota bacterium]|nr:tetratricopeptide repeat protein [Myxococcota bacterium]
MHRRFRRHLGLALLGASLLGAGGCAGGKRRTAGDPALPLAPLSGERVLVVVVAPEGSPPEGADSAARRALASLPVRIFPTDAVPELLGALGAAGPAAAAESLPRARDLRIPFVLAVTMGSDGAPGAATLASPFGEAPGLRWRAAGPVGADDGWSRLAAALLRDLPAEDLGPGAAAARRVLGREPWRGAPLDRLAGGLLLLAGGSLEEARAVAAPLVEGWPRDPAPRALHAMALRLGGAAGAEAELDRARGMHPRGESALLSAAMTADVLADGRPETAAALWAELRRGWPDRVDYGLRGADAVARTAGDGAAVRLLMSLPTSPDPGEGGPPRDPVSRARLALEGDRRLSLGWYLARQERTETAISAYDGAARLYRTLDLRPDLGRALNDSGVALADAGRWIRAVPRLREALGVRAEAGPGEELANTHFNLGMAYAGLGRDALADDHLLRAANAYGALGRKDDRLEALLQSIPARGRLGERASLAAAVEAALAVAQGRPEAEGRVRAASALARSELGEIEAAIQEFDRAEAAFRAAGDRLGEGRVAYDRAIPLVAAGRHREALATLEAARRIAEELDDRESIGAIDEQVERIRRLLPGGPTER